MISKHVSPISLALMLTMLSANQSISADESPTAIFQKYHQLVIDGKGAADLAPYRSAKVLSSQKSDSDRALSGLTKLLTPKSIRVTGEKIEGDRATVSAEALDEDPMAKAAGAKSKTLAKIKMVKEAGQWKIEEEQWSTYVGNAKPPTMAPGADNWCAGASKAEFPSKPAAGNLHGQPFKVVGAEYSSFMKTLTLKETNDMFSDREVKIFLGTDDPSMAGKQFLVTTNSDSFHSPNVQIMWKRVGKENPSQMYSASDGYGMRLQFGTPAKGLLPGYIVLRLPDKSSVEGYFYAAQK
ncbi:MAG: hypothetical protein K2W95_16585 [Candidatus Obscuribacterales bacterium]|nr:hypothetical protein [Candidatus Obscuribacterales bacterium]